MNRPITLTSDFGLEDAFVGVMKGVILGINPAARIVDICHNIGPQNVGEGAFTLASAYPYFPPDTVHVAVVDPGVGTRRRPIALATPKGFFVAPDNGLLTYVLAELDETYRVGNPRRGGDTRRGGFQTRPHMASMQRVTRKGLDLQSSTLDPSVKAVHLTERRFWLPKVSATFHGRDIFAPVAAHLSLGVPIEQLGEPITDLEMFPISKPDRIDTGTMVAHVIHVDRFGNLVTDARPGDLPPPPVSVTVRGRVIAGLSASYAGGDALVALIDSADRLEIALGNGSAAKELGAGVGEEVKIERTA